MQRIYIIVISYPISLSMDTELCSNIDRKQGQKVVYKNVS